MLYLEHMASEPLYQLIDRESQGNSSNVVLVVHVVSLRGKCEPRLLKVTV